MKVYNFVYNYGFLHDWLSANPRINRSELLDSLDMQDYGTLGKWIDGKTMMPLAQMMKFCNRWNVPVTAFFLNEEACADDVVAPIYPDSRIEPSGGWPQSERKAGKKVQDPRTETHEASALPYYVPTWNDSPADIAANKAENTSEAAAETLALTQQERTQYINTISGLTERISELSRENVRLTSLLLKAVGITKEEASNSNE